MLYVGLVVCFVRMLLRRYLNYINCWIYCSENLLSFSFCTYPNFVRLPPPIRRFSSHHGEFISKSISWIMVGCKSPVDKDNDMIMYIELEWVAEQKTQPRISSISPFFIALANYRLSFYFMTLNSLSISPVQSGECHVTIPPFPGKSSLFMGEPFCHCM